jgi:hypothetical protein
MQSCKQEIELEGWQSFRLACCQAGTTDCLLSFILASQIVFKSDFKMAFLQARLISFFQA